MAQFVEFTRFVPQDKKGGQPPSRVSVNVAHITAVVAPPACGTRNPLGGSGGAEHGDEHHTPRNRGV